MEVGQKIMISKGYVFKNYLKGTIIEHKTKEKKMTDVLQSHDIYDNYCLFFFKFLKNFLIISTT